MAFSIDLLSFLTFPVINSGMLNDPGDMSFLTATRDQPGYMFSIIPVYLFIRLEALFFRLVQQLVCGQYKEHEIGCTTSHNIFLLLPQEWPVEKFRKVGTDKCCP